MKAEVIGSRECADAFERIFWAFLFFVDFRVGETIRIDLIPDFIGWWLIASGLTSILALTPEIAEIRRLAYWLVVLSLFDIFELRLNDSDGPSLWSCSAVVLTGAVLILDVRLMWRLCGVIMEMASVVGNETIRTRAEFRRKLYVAMTIFVTSLIMVTYPVPPLVLMAIVVSWPLVLFIVCLMMALINGTARMCRELAASNGAGAVK